MILKVMKSGTEWVVEVDGDLDSEYTTEEEANERVSEIKAEQEEEALEGQKNELRDEIANLLGDIENLDDLELLLALIKKLTS